MVFKIASHLGWILFITWLTPSAPFTAGGGQADPEPAEGEQFPLRLPWWGSVSTHEPCGQGSQAERSLQCRGLYRGGCGLICQKGRQTAPARVLQHSDLHHLSAASFACGEKKMRQRATCCFVRSFQKITRQWQPWPKLSKRTCSFHTWMTTREGTCCYIFWFL